MLHRLNIVMKDERVLNVQININVDKARASELLNGQISQNPNGKIEFQAYNNETITLDIKDISHIIVI